MEATVGCIEKENTVESIVDFGEIIDAFEPRVYRNALNITNSRFLAEVVVQQVFGELEGIIDSEELSGEEVAVAIERLSYEHSIRELLQIDCNREDSHRI